MPIGLNQQLLFVVALHYAANNMLHDEININEDDMLMPDAVYHIPQETNPVP